MIVNDLLNVIPDAMRDAAWTAISHAERTAYPGATLESAALDINDTGWVVGYASTVHGRGATLWAPDGRVSELAPLVPELTSGAGAFRALRINAAGQIAGTLAGKDGARTVLLTPTLPRPTQRLPGAVGMLAH